MNQNNNADPNHREYPHRPVEHSPGRAQVAHAQSPSGRTHTASRLRAVGQRGRAERHPQAAPQQAKPRVSQPRQANDPHPFAHRASEQGPAVGRSCAHSRLASSGALRGGRTARAICRPRAAATAQLGRGGGTCAPARKTPRSGCARRGKERCSHTRSVATGRAASAEPKPAAAPAPADGPRPQAAGRSTRPSAGPGPRASGQSHPQTNHLIIHQKTRRESKN